MHSSQLKITSAFMGVVVLGVVLHSQSTKNTQIDVSEGAAIRQPASEVEKEALEIKNPVSKSDVYEFDRQMKAIINKNEVLTDIHYQGHLYVDWKEVSKNERVGLFSFQVNQSPDLPVFIEAKITKNFALIEMKESKANNENEESAILFLKDLISIYTFNTFEDTTGKYIASIKLLSEENGVQVWLKKKTEYEEPSLDKFKFNQSTHELRVTDVLEEASGSEDAQMGKELRTHSVYILKRLNEGELATAKLKKPVFDIHSTVHASTLKTNPNKTIQEKMTWDQVQGKLVSVKNLSAKERLSLFHDLVKSMKNNPEILKNFMEWTKANLADHQKTSIAIGVLASLGSVESQHEMVMLLDQSKNNPENAHMILNSLTTSGKKLSPESLGMLNSILDNSRDNTEMMANAAYALGASGDVKKITELASVATTKTDKMIYIDAMGNSGSVDSLPYLLESAQSSDPQIREKAIFALRFVDDLRVKPVFEQSMNDSNLNVRYSVVKAIQFQPNPQDYESILKNCAQQAQDANLKSLCSKTLVNL